jgi:hypothetical protein
VLVTTVVDCDRLVLASGGRNTRECARGHFFFTTIDEQSRGRFTVGQKGQLDWLEKHGIDYDPRDMILSRFRHQSRISVWISHDCPEQGGCKGLLMVREKVDQEPRLFEISVYADGGGVEEWIELFDKKGSFVGWKFVNKFISFDRSTVITIEQDRIADLAAGEGKNKLWLEFARGEFNHHMDGPGDEASFASGKMSISVKQRRAPDDVDIGDCVPGKTLVKSSARGRKP